MNVLNVKQRSRGQLRDEAFLDGEQPLMAVRGFSCDRLAPRHVSVHLKAIS